MDDRLNQLRVKILAVLIGVLFFVSTGPGAIAIGVIGVLVTFWMTGRSIREEAGKIRGHFASGGSVRGLRDGMRHPAPGPRSSGAGRAAAAGPARRIAGAARAGIRATRAGVRGARQAARDRRSAPRQARSLRDRLRRWWQDVGEAIPDMTRCGDCQAWVTRRSILRSRPAWNAPDGSGRVLVDMCPKCDHDWNPPPVPAAAIPASPAAALPEGWWPPAALRAGEPSSRMSGIREHERPELAPAPQPPALPEGEHVSAGAINPTSAWAPGRRPRALPAGGEYTYQAWKAQEARIVDARQLVYSALEYLSSALAQVRPGVDLASDMRKLATLAAEYAAVDLRDIVRPIEDGMASATAAAGGPDNRADTPFYG